MNGRLSIAINPQLKDKTAKLYKNMGMNLSTAVKIFFKQSLADHAMPFQPHETSEIPTKGTLEAMKELNHPKNLKSYTNTKQMMKDILNDNN